MATGYEDIDNLTNQQNSMLDESLKQQQDIVNKQTQMNIDALERNKAEVDEQATKTNQGLYSEYKKASNPYGVNAEQLYSKGLGNTGYAETTQTNLYNTYQKNVTDTINNAQKLKSDFDFQMSQARQNGDITLAQNALEIYRQKMQLLTQEYELKNNREQYLYQKEQDALAQNNWEKEFARQQERDQISDNQWQQSFDYNKSRDQISDNQWQQTFDYNKSRDDVSDRQYAEQMAYQKERDAVSDSQWAREYELSKKKSNSGSSKATRSVTGGEETIDSGHAVAQEIPSIDEILKNVQTVQGTSQKGNVRVNRSQTVTTDATVKDGISGKIFDSMEDLLNYYGYASIED